MNCNKGFVRTHAPGADLDYGFEWSGAQPWLAVGETIVTSTWLVVDDNPDITLSRAQISGSITSVFVAGGFDERDYRIRNTIVTSSSRTDVREMTLKCRIRTS